MKPIVSILLVVLCISCSTDSLKIKSGDIIFRGNAHSDLSQAINEVTQTSKSTNYSHIGICEVSNGDVFVYHSDLGKGVIREPLEAFITAKDSIGYTVDLYRIKTLEDKQIETALVKAKSLLGNSYNSTYILEDEGYYCSEYIYELFKADSIFKLEPMTFKNAETHQFHSGWITHYENLGIEIPEGKPGCNPNGMANNDNLMFIRKIK
ncbi:YiiX/YebB-like N1pC/P60 family cysteine hydrolase [Winogradskyella endarachnes]|uniref:YiiX/YebB-like N1pC/P60 family cysteine hydrolase n=1 Tax=Winogradskyella endarachnes TaxID=2681965 RepID=UPI0012F7AEEA|nr:YiiX/YebB-like N1pC/P60 family cysteine hydrolase [Winogradskyella endarachnes]